MKNCDRCLVPKQIDQFPKNKNMTAGILNQCITCVRACRNDFRLRNVDAVRAKDRERRRGNADHLRKIKQYRDTERGREIVRKAKEDWASRNKHKVTARIAVNNAVRDGRLLKEPCEVCGEFTVEGHHDDYSTPLIVRWLCDKHHKEHHNRMRDMQRAA